MFTRTEVPDYHLLEFSAPESSNALSLAAARALADFTLTKPTVVRARHPRIFCAGGNLTDHAAYRTAAEGLADQAEIARALDAFAARPVPKLAMIEGDAYGGGVEWLARFDVRFITPAAQLAFWQKRLGLSPGWGGGRAWAERIGEATLRNLLLEARPIGADEALRLGIVDRIVTPAAVAYEIEAWARGVHSPVNGEIVGWTSENEADVFRRLWWGAAHRAALAKFNS